MDKDEKEVKEQPKDDEFIPEDTVEDDEDDDDDFLKGIDLPEDLNDLSEDDISKLIDSMIDEDTKKEIKEKHPMPVFVAPSEGMFSNILIDMLVNFVITLGLVFAINGFFKVFNNTPFYIIIGYILIYTTIEYFIRKFIKKKWILTYMMTFGVLMVPISAILYGGIYYLLNMFLDITIINFGTFIGTFFLMVVVRFIINSYIARIKMKNFFSQMGGKK